MTRSPQRGPRTRIDTLCELVPPGSRVADIGTDRALLPRRLLADGRASHCIATERDAARAERARRSAIDLGDDVRFEIRAGDGLAVLDAADRVDVAVIAGLGGERIRSILERGHPQALGIRRLVLQPQTDAAAVRAWLGPKEFRIVEERLVRDGDRYFTIVAAQRDPAQAPGPDCSRLSAEDLLEVGPLLAVCGAPEVLSYWRHELVRLDRILTVAGAGTGRGRREAQGRREMARRVLAALTRGRFPKGRLRDSFET